MILFRDFQAQKVTKEKEAKLVNLDFWDLQDYLDQQLVPLFLFHTDALCYDVNGGPKTGVLKNGLVTL